jgi:hypothetical protein
MAAGAGLGAAVPFVGVGLQVLGMGLDIAQSIDAKKKQRDAERAAAESLAQAKSKIEVNRMEGLQVPLDAYEQAGREITAQQMQSLEGLREADARTLAAGVGKLGAVGAMATEKTRQQMADAIYQRDKMIADEQATIDRSLATINLQEAEGAQMAAAQREQMAAQALSGALTGLGGAAQTFYEGQSLYGSGRQAELDAASAYQQQTGMYGDMNARQARRAMIDSGITQQGFNNLASGLTAGGRSVAQTPIAPAMNIQPIMPTVPTPAYRNISQTPIAPITPIQPIIPIN